MEACGKSTTAIDKLLQTVRRTFEDVSEYDEWAMLGLNVRLPSGLRVKNYKLLSGRTTIQLESHRAHVQLERWALAKQIIHKHDLESWSKSTLKMPKATIDETEHGVRLRAASWLFGPTVGLVRLDAASNQIHTIRVRSRISNWEPQWDWFRT